MVAAPGSDQVGSHMEQDHGGSVSEWIVSLKRGDHDAARRLWERYFEQLVRLARGKLRGASPVVRDGEDVALSAFDSFCRALNAGRYPDLDDRDDLWKLLFVITVRKSGQVHRQESAARRDAARTVSLDHLSPLDLAHELERHAGQEPTPEQAALVADECRSLLEELDRHDPGQSLRMVALRKLEGYTNREIGEQLACTERTIKNRLRWIRGIWGMSTR